ncbi:MAG: thiol:disulfide interchange protein DsbA/DsbL [Pseudomonadota bacterium]
MVKRKENKARMARNGIIAFITVIAILMLGFATYVTTPLSDQDIAEGDYREVTSPKPRRKGSPVEVVEYFSYGCIHCKNFEPVIVSWAEDQGDAVAFSRVPAMFSPIQTMLGRTYLTLESEGALEQNHMRIFRAIHDAGRQFLTPDMIGDYIDGRGISKADFLRAYNAPGMRSATRAAEKEVRENQISATPSMLVGGRYVVGMQGGQSHALNVVEYLIEKIRAEESGSTSAAITSE